MNENDLSFWRFGSSEKSVGIACRLSHNFFFYIFGCEVIVFCIMCLCFMHYLCTVIKTNRNMTEILIEAKKSVTLHRQKNS